MASIEKSNLVGRDGELIRLRACIKARRNVLLEGPVGVGKTHLALAVTQELNRPVFRVDGDSRYSEQKLSGWFDPPTVIKKGFSSDSFVAGPLVEAMRSGGILFINELNRLPEGVQNILLPAIDERLVLIPKFGPIHAVEGFQVIATQNPKEFVATSHLSEAILDRFELVVIDYQPEQEEIQIVDNRLQLVSPVAARASRELKLLPRVAVALTRLTRNHPRIRRGASVRAAMSVAEIAAVFLAEGRTFEEAFREAVCLALPTRIELERDVESSRNATAEMEALLNELVSEVLAALDGNEAVKKKR